MKLVPNVVTKTIGKQVLIAQKNSPGLLFAAGAVGVIGTAVLAARATLRLEEVIEHTAADLEAVHELNREDKNTDDEARNMIIYIHAKGYLEIARLYAPAAICGVATIAALTGSHRMLTRRNAALTAAYKALDKTFRDYRDRVRDEVGEERENEIHKNVKREIVENEKGKEVELKYVDPNGISQYARFFDEFNKNWEKRAESNLIFLRAVQTYCNQLLHSRGYVMLNDVYDSLGMERSTAGCVVGWASNNGDGFVDFGIYNQNNQKAREFVNGDERSILLDFNVDGIVYEMIDKI